MSKLTQHVHLEDLRLAVTTTTDHVVGATVADTEAWRAQSFVDAMRGLRHLRNLVEILGTDLAERDLAVLKEAAAQQQGGAT